MSDYDVIIVGTGAGGGTLARHLAPSGKRILLLERGDWLPREPQNWSAADVFIDNRYISSDKWYDANGKAFQPQVHYFVGGATKLYGAALYRLRREDFGELKHHDGLSPAWPIGYDDMEPYYTKAEQLYQVHGARGEDPTEPPASAPYPFPALSHEPRIQQLSDDLAAAGRHPFHAPCGVMLDEANPPFSPCIRCATCDGFPCLVHAKTDAEVLGVRPALEHPNVTLVTNAQAVKLATNDAGTAVTGVEVDHDGAREVFTADLYVVSCGAATSAKLLLASASDAHPNGLANGSDQVGRNYVFHNSRAFLAVSREKNPTHFQKTLGLNDYYF
ncbi:MAG TPA: GMC family oxidoreductase, partial [Actinomycetes bacterium]|nr:GMC family oxidoreductase [Actinomycetes bacterium]